MNNENKSAAERIIDTLLQSGEGHLYHGRCGVVTTLPALSYGAPADGLRVVWQPARLITPQPKDGEIVPMIVPRTEVHVQPRKGAARAKLTRVGWLQANQDVHDGDGKKVAEFRRPGLFREMAAWMYRRAADVWRLDNEFAARWASYAFGQTHRDLKIVLAALMLAQSRHGKPVMDRDPVSGREALSFFDADYRDVGAAMLLTYKGRPTDMDPKQIMRVAELLRLPEVAAINRELGFGHSGRRPTLGRWSKATATWLRYRERNPAMMDGLVKAGFRRRVQQLAKAAHYKPESPDFFTKLRWAQSQAEDGRRTLALDAAAAAALAATDDWAGLSERQVCERIVREHPSWKFITGRMASEPSGMTRAMWAALVEAGSLSDKDLVILTPTLEATGVLGLASVQARWKTALSRVEDARARNVAQKVSSKDAKALLEAAADKAVQKAVAAAEAEMGREFTVYVFVDISGSMQASLEAAKVQLARLVHAFPPERLFVYVFNTSARRVTIPARSQKGVEMAFAGIQPGGGTDYGIAVKRAAEETQPVRDTDVLFLFVGDEEATEFARQVEVSRLKPLAFAFLRCGGGYGQAVRQTASALGLPCLILDENTLSDADPYVLPRTLRALVASTPVDTRLAYTRPEAPPRKSIVDIILGTDLLKSPAWAA